MKDFNNVIAFSKTSTKSKELVEAMQGYARHYMFEEGGNEKYKFGLPAGTLSQKADVVRNLAVDVLQSRAKYSLADAENDVYLFSSHPTVQRFWQSTNDIVLDAVLPLVFDNSALSTIAQFHFAGYGEAFKFDIEDPTLYDVKKLGRHMKHGEAQEKEKSSVSIITEPYGVTVVTNLPDVMLGKVDIAREVMKQAMSIQRKVYQMTVSAFVSAVGAATNPFKLTNYTELEAIKILQKVSAYNNRKAVLLGDPTALKFILPSNTQTRVLLQDEYNTTLGFMSKFNTYDVLALDPVATGDSAFGLTGLGSDNVYAVSLGSEKLIHVAIGASMSNLDGNYDNSNLSIMNTIRKEIGVGLATNRFAGVIGKPSV